MGRTGGRDTPCEEEKSAPRNPRGCSRHPPEADRKKHILGKQSPAKQQGAQHTTSIEETKTTGRTTLSHREEENTSVVCTVSRWNAIKADKVEKLAKRSSRKTIVNEALSRRLAVMHVLVSNRFF